VKLLPEFFRSFRREFGLATKLWLLILGVGAVLAVDVYVYFTVAAGSPILLGFTGLLVLIYLILPVLINAFNVIVMRAFFQELPQELFESAAIDGASNATILFRIVLPLSKAVLAVVGLFYAVAYWNAFFNALLYIQSTDKWPMALVLRTYVVNQTTIGGDQVSITEALPPQLSLQMATLVIAIVPILIVYPFLQRHFAKGVMIGAVKG
jgi:multiple sugar transport system permease protein/putative aldouronate transport system permease protein